jgi:cation:H+ antiporter
MVFLDQRIALQTAATHGPDESASEAVRLSLGQSVVGFLIATLVILISGPYLAESAGTIASLSGLGNTFIGTTLVALCTSLPELAASLAAIRMGSFDLAVGNVFGSNAFNMLLFFPLDFMHTGDLFAVTATTHAISAFAAIVATSVVIIGQLYHVERRKRLLEPDALTVIAMILAALALIYYAA